jgi:hypothetical protein
MSQVDLSVCAPFSPYAQASDHFLKVFLLNHKIVHKIPNSLQIGIDFVNYSQVMQKKLFLQLSKDLCWDALSAKINCRWNELG